METVYEKVCPACGRSATLAAKFCSGCGHQYRTVFHDQEAQGDGAVAAQADAGFRFEAPWMPFVLAVAPVILIAFLWVFISGSNQNQTTPTVAPSYQSVSNAGGATDGSTLPTYGQRQADVAASLGQPINVKHDDVSGQSDWFYQRGSRTLRVHFNSNNVVESFTNY